MFAQAWPLSPNDHYVILKASIEEIRKDRLLDDIENEWFWEDIDGTQEPPNEI